MFPEILGFFLNPPETKMMSKCDDRLGGVGGYVIYYLIW